MHTRGASPVQPSPTRVRNAVKADNRVIVVLSERERARENGEKKS